MEREIKRSLVVIGASAGGVDALTALCRSLPATFPAAIALVLHLPPSGTSVLPAILQRAGKLPATAAGDGAPLRPGEILVAPPDHHLVVTGDRVGLTHGPRENGLRPAADTLFRTAALSRGTDVVGVVLSGTLDDGTAGLSVIKEHGGVAVVQDPADASYGGMPRSAIEHVAVDHVVPIAGMAELLCDLVAAGDPGPAVLAGGQAGPDPVVEMAPEDDRASGLICPECGGALWSLEEGGVPRFRCRIGHAFSEETLPTEQGTRVEGALWAGLRALEERAALLRRMARRARARGNERTARGFEEKAQDADRQAEIIRAGVLPVALHPDEAAS